MDEEGGFRHAESGDDQVNRYKSIPASRARRFAPSEKPLAETMAPICAPTSETRSMKLPSSGVNRILVVFSVNDDEDLELPYTLPNGNIDLSRCSRLLTVDFLVVPDDCRRGQFRLDFCHQLLETLPLRLIHGQ
jgi:hypothetical protein